MDRKCPYCGMPVERGTDFCLACEKIIGPDPGEQLQDSIAGIGESSHDDDHKRNGAIEDAARAKPEAANKGLLKQYYRLWIFIALIAILVSFLVFTFYNNFQVFIAVFVVLIGVIAVLPRQRYRGRIPL